MRIDEGVEAGVGAPLGLVGAILVFHKWLDVIKHVLGVDFSEFPLLESAEA